MHRETNDERLLNCRAGRATPSNGLLAILFLQHCDVVRNLDARTIADLQRSASRFPLAASLFPLPASRIQDRRLEQLAVRGGGVRLDQSPIHFGIRHRPFDDEAVGSDAAVQQTLRLAVHLLYVLSDAHAEHVEIEVGVARDEWIVRPVDHRCTQFADDPALVFLESPTETKVPRFRPHGEHVRPVDDPTSLPFDTGQAVDEAEQMIVFVECTGRDPADALRHLENARRHDIGECVAPCLALERDACPQLLLSAQWPNVDLWYVHHDGWRANVGGDGRGHSIGAGEKVCDSWGALKRNWALRRTFCPTRPRRPVRRLASGARDSVTAPAVTASLLREKHAHLIARHRHAAVAMRD